MGASALKSGINKLLQKTNDEKLLRIVFNLMNDYTEEEAETNSLLSETQWKEINSRIGKYEAGKSKGYSLAEMKKQINTARKK